MGGLRSGCELDFGWDKFFNLRKRKDGRVLLGFGGDLFLEESQGFS